MEKKADIKAQRDALVLVLNDGAKELHELAANLTRVKEALPPVLYPGVKELLDVHARSAKALASVFAIATADPDPESTHLLHKLGKRTAIVAAGAVIALGYGVADAAGVDVWDYFKDKAGIEQAASEPHRQNQLEPDPHLAPEPDSAGVERATEFKPEPGFDRTSRQAYRNGGEFAPLMGKLMENPATLNIELGDEAVTVYVNNGGDPKTYADVGRALAKQGISLILADQTPAAPAPSAEEAPEPRPNAVYHPPSGVPPEDIPLDSIMTELRALPGVVNVEGPASRYGFVQGYDEFQPVETNLIDVMADSALDEGSADFQRILSTLRRGGYRFQVLYLD